METMYEALARAIKAAKIVAALVAATGGSYRSIDLTDLAGIPEGLRAEFSTLVAGTATGPSQATWARVAEHIAALQAWETAKETEEADAGYDPFAGLL